MIEIYCVILRALSGHFLYELLVEGVMVKDAVSATTPANGTSNLRWPARLSKKHKDKYQSSEGTAKSVSVL